MRSIEVPPSVVVYSTTGKQRDVNELACVALFTNLA